MGKCMKIFLLTSAVLVALAAYVLYEPLPDYMDEYWKTELWMASTKFKVLTSMIWLPFGSESLLNITRRAYSESLGSSQMRWEKGGDLLITDEKIEGVPVRIYKPKDAKGKLPALVYFHGGAWVLLNIDDYDDVMVNQALAGNLVAISVEYRLAPEHPFPKGFEDCVTVTRHVLRHGDKYGVDSKRVAIGGDSAGGNLAAAVAIQLRDEKVSPPVKAQVLIYGALTFCSVHSPIYEYRRHYDRDSPVETLGWFIGLWHDMTENQVAVYKAQNFTPEFIARCEKYNNLDLLPQSFIQPGYKKFQYPKCEVTQDVKFVSERLMDFRVSPALADNLKGLPPAFLLSCQWDYVRDDSAFYAKRLEQAGVKVEWLNLPDSFHGVFNMVYGRMQMRRGVESHQAVTAFLKKHL